MPVGEAWISVPQERRQVGQARVNIDIGAIPANEGVDSESVSNVVKSGSPGGASTDSGFGTEAAKDAPGHGIEEAFAGHCDEKTRSCSKRQQGVSLLRIGTKSIDSAGLHGDLPGVQELRFTNQQDTRREIDITTVQRDGFTDAQPGDRE